MRAEFLKMHGAGNDFVVFDERRHALALTPTRIAALSDRQRGIGCDQLIRLQAPVAVGADVRMLIHNRDGSNSATCGNATRCVASLVAGDRMVVETEAGLLRARRVDGGLIEVDMGAPGVSGDDVPLADPGRDTLHLPLPGDPAACSMGNPHATVFVDDLDAVDVERDGSALADDAMFATGANVGFAQIMGTDTIRLAVWERGTGVTLACGSGACATLVNAHRRGLIGRRARVLQAGGVLEIAWRAEDGRVLMTGPVATAFAGSVELEDFSA